MKSGTVLKIVVKQGNINNFWGDDFELKNEWEKKTGIMIDARVRPQLAVLDFMREFKNFDITLARQREYPDLASENLISDLTPFVTKYAMVLDDNATNGFIHPRMQTEFDGKIVAIPADGDISTIYVRKDLIENSENRERFKKTHGRELGIPQTWENYQELVEFFHDPSKPFYGSCEQRDPLTGWMFWMPRYICQDAPARHLFDADMHPLIDSEAGIAATESYLATLPFSPPGILEKGNDYSFFIPIYQKGIGFSMAAPLSIAKALNLEFSSVKNKYACIPMPGKMINGKLNRKTMYIYGNNIVVAQSSQNKELAFLYAMWFSDPDVSLKSVMVKSGMADPYRMNHFNDRKVWAVYSKQAVDNMKVEFGSTVPAGTGLPGDTEYINALNNNLWQAGMKKMSAKEAMRKTAEEWEEITERRGRQNQIRYFDAFRDKFPK